MEFKLQETEEIEKYKDYKEEMLAYIQSQEFELLTEAKIDEVRAKRWEFIKYLDAHNLLDLLNAKLIKTDYMWDCVNSIQDILMNFDAIITQYMEQYNNELYTQSNCSTAKNMSYFDIELSNRMPKD